MSFTQNLRRFYSKFASIPEIRDRIKLFTENLTKFMMLAIEADRAEWKKRPKISNFVKFLVSQLIRPHCSASDATLNENENNQHWKSIY